MRNNHQSCTDQPQINQEGLRERGLPAHRQEHPMLKPAIADKITYDGTSCPSALRPSCMDPKPIDSTAILLYWLWPDLDLPHG